MTIVDNRLHSHKHRKQKSCTKHARKVRAEARVTADDPTTKGL